MKKFVRSSSMVAMAASAIFMCSCSKNFDFSLQQETVTDEYAKGWENAFGEIDSNQDWNLATQRTVTVTVGETSEVNIYTKGLDKSYLLAKSTVSGTTDISFDARKDLAEVYVVAIAGDKRDVRTVNVTGETAAANFTSSATRAAMRADVASLPNRELVYALGYNLVRGQQTDAWARDYVDLINLGGYDETYNYSSWNSNIYASGKWATTENQPAPETGTEVDMASLNDVKTGCAALYTTTDDDITKLYPFTQNYKMVTAKAQEITLTGIFRNTAGNTALLYYYTAPGATTDQLKSADKYVLIPNTQNIVDKEYKLIYYDPNNNYAPTYTFPENVEIHFALAINPSCMTKCVNWTIETGNIIANVMRGGLISFSDEALNTDMYQNANAAGKYGAWTSMASSAVYKYNGVNIISFEDWGGQFTVTNGVPQNTSGSNSIDWNDIAFAINAEFQTPPPPVEEEQEEGESWIIACEDLGDTDDYDFNDVVFKVSHVSGQKTATVTPLAAGGTLESWIVYNNQYLGETHQLLGAKENTSGSYPMINTTKITATATTPQEVNVPENFTITNNMGGFSIIVKSKNNSDSNAVLITAPSAGAAPQMFCVPSTWAWPTERTKIQDAYPDFATWSANSNNIEWYNNATAGKVIGGQAQ
ncbi:MAG: DUF4842 domain-containing protein [Prevotella sp.]|nr:DUF4842 domain-containing protein [Prevotella sp.]